MKAAIICPTSMLEWIQAVFQPDFHMVLAQIYLEDSDYAGFFRERRAAGDFILLDQGAAELGAAIDTELYWQVIRELRPTVAVAPDVLHSALSTVRRTGAFLDDYRQALTQLDVQVMGVPQGQTCEECLLTYKLFQDWPGIDWIGVSKFHHDKFVSRYCFLEAAKELGAAKPCHLLGVSGLVHDLYWERPMAQSVDTAKPVKLGLQTLKLEEEWLRVKHQGFFATPLPPEAVLDIVWHNIQHYLVSAGAQEEEI